MKKFLPIFFLGVLTTLWLVFVLTPVFYGQFFFTFDQGRDMLWIKNQVDFKSLALVGPWGSLSGVFFGPLWFWLLTVPYILSGGNPVAVTSFNSFIVLLAILVGGFFFAKTNRRLGFIFIILGLLNPVLRGIAGYAFSQHLLPLLTICLIYVLWQAALNKKLKYFFLGTFLAGLMFHAEPPTSLLSLPSILIVAIVFLPKKPMTLIKFCFVAAAGFLLGILPLIMFDVRHNFIQTKSILSYLEGQNQSLGGVLPMGARIIDRLTKFISIFGETVKVNGVITLLVLALTGFVNMFLVKSQKVRTLILVTAIYAVSLLFSFIIFPPELKGFYLDGLATIFVLWIAISVDLVINSKFAKVIALFVLGVLIYINFNISSLQSKQTVTSIYANEVTAVDWIYTDAKNTGFKVYTFSPAVYDFPYQYIFFNHALSKYGYLPEEFSYLPNVPEYVLRKSDLLANSKNVVKKSEGNVYLIIDPSDYAGFRQKWLENFPIEKFPLLDRFVLPDQTVIEKRGQIL